MSLRIVDPLPNNLNYWINYKEEEEKKNINWDYSMT